MTEIPPDIMKLAREAIMAEVKPDVRWQYADGRCDHFAVVKAVAKAIMNERERCARIAYSIPRYTNSMVLDMDGVLPPGSPYDRGRYDARKDILREIGCTND